VVSDVEQTAVGPLEFVRPLWPVVLFVGVLRQLVIGDSTVREALVCRPFQVIDVDAEMMQRGVIQTPADLILLKIQHRNVDRAPSVRITPRARGLSIRLISSKPKTSL
jgi:hypothetical protein